MEGLTTARELAVRLKRETRHGLTLELCEAVLGLKEVVPNTSGTQHGNPRQPDKTTPSLAREATEREVLEQLAGAAFECPVCAARRLTKAESMRRYRGRKNAAP